MQLPVTYNIFVLSNETKLIYNWHNFSQKIVGLSHHNPSPPRILALAEYSKFRDKDATEALEENPRYIDTDFGRLVRHRLLYIFILCY